jgi:ADP-ribose pyrophosphatase
MKIIGRRVLARTAFLDLISVDYVDYDGKQREWFGVTRTNAPAAVAIAAITEDDELVMIRQPRPLLGDIAVELPAGLMDQEGEDVLETAARELLEETGYQATKLRLLVGGQSGMTVSSGLTDERLYLVLATGARQIAMPKPDEATVPFLVPLATAFDWAQSQAEVESIDFKLFGTIRLLEKEILG